MVFFLPVLLFFSFSCSGWPAFLYEEEHGGDSADSGEDTGGLEVIRINEEKQEGEPIQELGILRKNVIFKVFGYLYGTGWDESDQRYFEEGWYSGDVDWYYFFAAMAGDLSVLLDWYTSEEDDYDIFLFSVEDYHLGEILSTEGYTLNMPETFTYPIQANEYYVIAVGGYSGAPGYYWVELRIL